MGCRGFDRGSLSASTNAARSDRTLSELRSPPSRLHDLWLYSLFSHRTPRRAHHRAGGCFKGNSPHERRLTEMARKTIRVSDRSGQEIADGKGATVRITFTDARKGARE